MRIDLVPAEQTDSDAKLVMQWRNDPMTRAASFHQDEKQWPAFGAEYRGYFAGAPLPPLFGVADGERVAFVRFRSCVDPERIAVDGAVDISINVAPGARGRGVGRAVIATATAHALAQPGVTVVLAEIRPGNGASVRAFLGAGYRRVADGEHEVDGVAVAVERYVARPSGG